ncbi:helix-turn-helix domain-containing protein [Bengtsoniella intestinalis]|uniref:helix-turn-helix domain-containing protein n=1 Tax=Bengtsoniella intestinalis TaxID=3073143 RepID=UPI00391F02EB
MISYNPLWHTLLDKGIGKMELANLIGLSRATMAKMGKDEAVALSVIERICIAIDCQIEDVVKISGQYKMSTPIPSKGSPNSEGWDPALIRDNQRLGGGFELCHVEDGLNRKKKASDE